MGLTPKWKGSTALQEDPSSPRRVRTAEGVTFIRLFRGPYATCLAEEPAIGSQMEGYDENIFIEQSEVRRAQGGSGVLQITAATIDAGDPPEEANDFLPTYEIEWITIQKPLADHPRYAPGGYKELTVEDLAEVELFLKTEDIDLTADWKFEYKDQSGITQTGTLTENAQDYAGKLRRGQENYRVYLPVTRRTSQVRNMPRGSSAGTRQASPIPGSPGGYDYLKTADRGVKSGRFGKWERIEEWTGFDYIDTDIYT